MARRNTVNFLQIENGLQSAIATCEAEAEAPYAQRYRGRLVEIAQYLDDATRRADHTYLDWRAAMRERLLVAKGLWQAFERVRDEIQEYGIEAQPTGRVSYFEPGAIEGPARELIAFLGTVDPDEVVELSDWTTELRERLEALVRAKRDEDKALADYRHIAPLRRQAIYRATEAVDEFRAVRGDYLR